MEAKLAHVKRFRRRVTVRYRCGRSFCPLRSVPCAESWLVSFSPGGECRCREHAGTQGLTAVVKHVRGDRCFCVWNCSNKVRRYAPLWRAFWHSVIIIRKKERKSLTTPLSLICQESHEAWVGGLLFIHVCFVIYSLLECSLRASLPL